VRLPSGERERWEPERGGAAGGSMRYAHDGATGPISWPGTRSGNLRFDVGSEMGQRRVHADLMVCVRNTGRNALGNDRHDGATVAGVQHPMHRHRPGECRIRCIELERLDDALLRHQFDKMPNHHIRVGG